MTGARKATRVERAFNEDPAWPRALARLLAGESIRSIATALGTNPRRLRRAFARAAVRVAGANVDRAGVPALAPFRARLGTEPDAGIAREAGVTPQAVQGERRRLGIEAFRPAPLLRLSAEERSWIVGSDMAPVRHRRHTDEVALAAVVVKKPARVGARADGVTPAAANVGPGVAASVPPVALRGAGVAPAAPLATQAAGVISPAAPPSGFTPRLVLTYRPSDPLPPPADGPPRRTHPSADWHEARRLELERLIRGTQHTRSDRRRIVRAETPILESAAPKEAPARRSRTPEWRAADPAVLEAVAAEAARQDALAEAARREAEAARVAAAAAEAARLAAAQEAAEAARNRSARGDAPPEERLSTAPAPAAGPSTTEDRGSGAAVDGPPSAWPDLPTWAVHAEGLNEIVYVLAADLLGAIAAAAAALPQDRFPILAVEAA